MKIKIKKMYLENYKGVIENTINFFQKTKITGRNKAGKSTIADGYFDILTGKLADGTTPDGIRRHDENGEDIDKVDIIREVELEIDERPATIRKITKQKWRKPRGQAEEVFDGNVTTYEIDGFEYNAKKFTEFMEKIAKPDILLMCSNATPFLTLVQKSTVEARKFLEKLAGFDLDKFVKEMGADYAEVSDITSGHSIEDTLKKLRKQLAAQKKKLEAKNTEIKYEKSRTADTPQIEVSDLELSKGEWRDKLAEIDRQEQALDESAKAYDDLSVEIRDLKVSLNGLSNGAYVELEKRRMAVDSQIKELEVKNKGFANDLRMAEMDLRHAEMGIQRHKADLEKAQDDYSKCLERKFDETKLHEIETEQFDENSLICPTCKQIRPSGQQEELRERFEKDKADRIKEQQDAKERFDAKTNKMFDEITEMGSAADKALKEAKAAKTEAEQKISEIKKQILSVSAEIENLSGELAKLPKEVDMSCNEEYQKLSAKIAEKEKSLAALDNGSFKRAELRKQRNEYMAEISKIDSQIQKINADAEEKERRLEKLETELRELSQIAADIERQIYIVTDFSVKKNEKLAELINPYFDAFDFVFTGQTIEGGIYETLRIVRDGTDYFGGLNTSDRILCDISLVRGFQKMNGLNLPIFVDNCESINADRIPDMEQQLILLEVSDGDLEVKEM